MVETVQGVIAVKVDDGLSYDPDSLRAHIIRQDDDYNGDRITAAAQLATARLQFHLDGAHGVATNDSTPQHPPTSPTFSNQSSPTSTRSSRDIQIYDIRCAGDGSRDRTLRHADHKLSPSLTRRHVVLVGHRRRKRVESYLTHGHKSFNR
jgi:hypothetical protein